MDLYNAPSEQIRESQRRQAEPATTTKDASTNLSVVPSCSSPARQSSWSREDTPPPNNSPDHIPPTITGTPRAAHSSIHTSSSPSHVMLANISTACQSSSPTEIVSAPLPTLSEDRLERNDSTMSTGVVVTDSKVARRHQPTSVYIRKSQERHHSLPTMLPLVESQPSLADDLSKWILPVSHRKKLGGTEWKSYRPGIPQPESSSENFPGKEQRMEDDQIRRVATPDFPEEIETCNLSPGSRVISLRRSTELFFDVPVRHSHTEADRKDIRPQQRHSLDRDSSTSIRSTTSSITRKPIPTPSILQLAINTPLPELPKTTHSHYDIEKDIGVESSSEVNQPNDEVRNSVEDAASTASTPTPSSSSNSISSAILVESPTTHLSDDAELSLLQQRLLCQTYVTPKINGSKPTSKEATQIEQVSEKIKHAKHVKEDRSEELSAKGQDLDRSETSTEEIMRVTAELEKPPSVGNVPPIVEDALSSLDDELPSVDDELPAAGKESFSVDVEPIFKVPTPADTFKAATDSLKKVHEDETPRPIPTAPQRPPPALSSKPLTAQARRRAAHQRRMELAFGAD